MYEDDPKKQALIEAEKMLHSCPLCGKRENVTIDFDIVGMTTIKCSCGLTVGPIFGLYKCVERYNNRVGEEKYKYEMYMMEERLLAMYDDYSRLLDKYEKAVNK